MLSMTENSCLFENKIFWLFTLFEKNKLNLWLAQSAEAVQYTDYISAGGVNPPPYVSWLWT